MVDGTPGVCAVCGNNDVTQYTCPQCGGMYCAAHRSPDKHDCSSLYSTFSAKSGKAMDMESSSEMYYRMNDFNKARDILAASHKKKKRRNMIVLAIASILLILISGIGYMAYSTYTHYQPLIGDYEKKVESLKLAYSDVEKYTGLQDSDYDFLSADWLNAFNVSIYTYRQSADEAVAAGNLVRDCPYYNVSYIVDNEKLINDSLKQMLDSYNAPYHTVRLCPGEENTVFVYPNGTHCYITEYRDARDPTYERLLSFLKSDRTEEATYVNGSYVCTNFAITLHDHAEANLIRAHIVDLDFQGIPDGHMIVAFNTVDKGLVYIDDTGNKIEDKQRGVPSIDAIVYPAVGKAYQPKYLFPTLAGSWYLKSIGTVSELNLIS